ncbi:MAG: hypothetical protein JSR67_05065 [Proteobacteria bacterium]|nr:hypothetical protein [Pseudomonadota bacterium]
MNLLVQQVLVTLLVLVCVLLAAWRLASVRLRLKLLDALERIAPLPLAGWRARLRQRALAQLTAACGGCSRADAGAAAATPGHKGRGLRPALRGLPGRTTPGGQPPNRTPGAPRR